MDPIIPLALVAAAVVLAFVFWPRKKGSAEAAPPAPKYKVTHYSGDEIVGTYLTARYTTGDGRLYFVQEGHDDYSIISGTYVLERVNDTPNDQDSAEERRYQVSLFSNGKKVREWKAHRYTTGDGRLYIVPFGMSDYTIISGTYIIEPVVSGADAV